MQNEENSPQIDQRKVEIDYRGYYRYVVRSPWIRPVVATYGWTKHRCTALESALDSVEDRVSTVVQRATNKVLDAHYNYYVRPKRVVTSMYSTGLEKSKVVVETSKQIAVKGGTFGLGAAVVATQLSLAVSTGCALLILNSIGEAQKTGQDFMASIRETEKAVEQTIMGTVEQGMRIVKIPVDKVTESANIFLDIVTVFVERTFGIVVDENPELTVMQRVRGIAYKIVDFVYNKAQIIDPFIAPLRVLLEQLKKSFALVDYIRGKGEWALGKVDELSSSVYDIKKRIENEAKQYGTEPEELLMRTIRSLSAQLSDNLQALKDKKIFADGTRMEGVISYLHELHMNLVESNNLFEVRDEVLSEARLRFSEMSAWMSHHLKRQKK